MANPEHLAKLHRGIADWGEWRESIGDSVDLRGANLQGCDLHNAELSGVDLGKSDLEGANLTSANLCMARLTNANLSGANLTCADLSAARMSGANLSGAHLRDSSLHSADLTRADLRRADLNGADLNGAHLVSADLGGADLSGSNLNAADLREATLREVKLSETDLRGADLSRAIVSSNSLREAKLSEAKLVGVDLRGADLRSANLSGADLSSADLSGANLSSANLSGANLSGANLSGASLSSVNLTEADCTDTILHNADMSNANASRTRFIRTHLKGARATGIAIIETQFTETVGAPSPPDKILLGDLELFGYEALLALQGYTPRSGLTLFFQGSLNATEQFLVHGVVAVYETRGIKCQVAEIVNHDDASVALVRIVARRLDDLVTLGAAIHARMQQSREDSKSRVEEAMSAAALVLSREIENVIVANMRPLLSEVIDSKLKSIELYASKETWMEWLQWQGDEYLKRQCAELFDTPGRRLARLPKSLLEHFLTKNLGASATAEVKAIAASVFEPSRPQEALANES